MIRVVLVDDQQLLRRCLRLLFDTMDGMEVVGEAAEGHEALAVVAQADVDVVLADARMPGLDGLGLVTACREMRPGLPVLMLSTYDDDDLVRDALKAGAAGFLLKDSSPEALADGIRAAHAGGLVVDPRVAKAVISPRARTTAVPDPLAFLSPTEKAVASLLAQGRRNEEIAQELALANGTVRNHVSSILHKLDQRDRTSLALMLYRTLHE